MREEINSGKIEHLGQMAVEGMKEWILVYNEYIINYLVYENMTYFVL